MPQVCDFGHARLRKDDDASLTQSAGGTPRYKDPAVSSGRAALRKASDVYSFAVLAWQVLTGSTPFAGMGADALKAHAEAHGRPPLDLLPPDTPPEVQALIERCWAGEQAHRPSAAEVSAALQPFRE